MSSYLLSEQAASRLLGPFLRSDHIHISPIGLVPKSHHGDAWRMIVDLSHPGGRRVNDAIPANLCSLHYPFVDNVVDCVLALGRYTELIKIDLKSVYRLLPMHWRNGTSWGCAGRGVSTSIFVCHLASSRPRKFLQHLPMCRPGSYSTRGFVA